MLKSLVYKITGDPNEKAIQRIQPLVHAVNDLEAEFERLSDDALRAKIATRGREFVTTTYDWDRAVERMEHLFQEAVR